jgi:ABC-2 type transport system permease protein
MIARIYAAEIRAELTKLTRLPAYAIPTIAFPVAFYVFFGILTPQQNGAEAACYLLGSFGAFGTIGAALFGFGVGIAMERGQGWLAVKRASPMPPSAYVVAKVCGSLVFAMLISAVMFGVAAFAGHVTLHASQWAVLAAVLIFGGLPFCALGLAIGVLVRPNSAAAVVNLVYLPLSFCAGLWIPISQLPAGVRAVAPFLPTYHLGQLALGAVGFGSGAALGHVTALALWTCAGLGVAVWTLSRDEGRAYG